MFSVSLPSNVRPFVTLVPDGRCTSFWGDAGFFLPHLQKQCEENGWDALDFFFLNTLN